MADLKLLTERVVEKEKAAIRERVEQAKVKAEDDLQAYEAEEVTTRQQLKEEIEEEYRREYEIKKNTLLIQKRNELLAAKQELLNKVFLDAIEELDNIDALTFQGFTKSVLNRFDAGSVLTLSLGEKSADLIDRNWLSQNVPSHLTVDLSENTVSKKSGLIIEKEGIDYNFLFDSLVEDIKPEILPEISNHLF
ncbi:V-type ATPase subunit E [Alkalibacterium iburiense]|uniref:V-type ATPase subunit E n=1 Tax=Alkalibacterium iburiense TaxID=290589 RepID=A0ABN0X0V7_9LACT